MLPSVIQRQRRRERDFQASFESAFSASSEYLLVTKVPSLEKVEAEKLKKTDKDQMPMNSLVISCLSEGWKQSIRSNHINYRKQPTGWLTSAGAKKDSTLYIRSLDGMLKDSFPAVSDFGFAKKGNVLYAVSDSVLYTYIPRKGNNRISVKRAYSRRSHSTKTAASSPTCFVP